VTDTVFLCLTLRAYTWAYAKANGLNPQTFAIGIKGLPPEKFIRVYAKLDKNLSNNVDLVDFDENDKFYNLLNSLGEIVEIG